MNIYETIYMLAAIEELPLEHTFFKSRYFPTDDVMDVFNTSKVLADYREGKAGSEMLYVIKLLFLRGREGLKQAVGIRQRGAAYLIAKLPAIRRITKQGGQIGGGGTIPDLSSDGLRRGKVGNTDAAGGRHGEKTAGANIVALLLVPGKKGGNIVRRNKERERYADGVKIGQLAIGWGNVQRSDLRVRRHYTCGFGGGLCIFRGNSIYRDLLLAVGWAACLFAGAVTSADNAVWVQVFISYAGRRPGVVSAVKGDEVVSVVLLRRRWRNPLFIPPEIAGFNRKEYHVLAGLATLYEIFTLARLRRDTICTAALVVVDIGGNTLAVHETLAEEAKRLCSGMEQAVFKFIAGRNRRGEIITMRRDAGLRIELTIAPSFHKGGGENRKKSHTDTPYNRIPHMASEICRFLAFMDYYHDTAVLWQCQVNNLILPYADRRRFYMRGH